jgi:2,4-dienoyl-CoA reductase (NADPH2)
MAKLLFEWDYTSSPGERVYPHLFKPIQIGNLVVPNRIKYAVTANNLNAHDGSITDAYVAYMKVLGEGAVGGLCFMQGVYMDEARQGQGYVGQAAAWDDKFIPGLKRVADALHAEKAIAGFQLMDCGRVGAVKVDCGRGPSSVQQRLRNSKPMKEMTNAEVKAIIRQQVDGARRGVEAGFDVVEISGVAGDLISNFLSSFTKRGTDEYGGNFRGRMQAAVKIIQGVKAACGPDIPVGIRLCSKELPDDVRGNAPEEWMQAYKIAEEAGVDYISANLGWRESIRPVIGRHSPMENWVHLAKQANPYIPISVQMGYRFLKPDLLNEKIGSGELDIWEMNSSMIDDPLMPKKVLEGREEEIRHCMACNFCDDELLTGTKYQPPIFRDENCANICSAV